MRRTTLSIVVAILLASTVRAGQVGYSGDCSDGCATKEDWTASNANEVKTAVDDNDARVTTHEGTPDAHHAQTTECSSSACDLNASTTLGGAAVQTGTDDDVPESGDFGAGADLEADGSVTDGAQLTPTTRVQSYTGNQALSATDTHCSVVTNDGATGGVTLTLPEAATGLCVLIILAEAQDVDVDPQGVIDCSLGAGCDQIIGETDQAGELLSSDATVGSSLSLVGLNADEWLVTGKAGTWAEESP